MLLEDNFYRILSRSVEDCGIVFTVALDPGHRIYKAHFPGYPVTPGVCLVEMAVEMASEISGRKLSLCGAKEIKFLVPAFPSETNELRFCFDGVENIKVFGGETLFAKMRLNLE